LAPEWRIPGKVWRQKIPGLPDSAAPEMVTIPSGGFTMGSPDDEDGRGSDEGPQHLVRVDYVLAIGKYPVTFAEWDAILASGARLAIPDDEGWGRERRPVINVSWEDAHAYLAWLNGELGLAGRPDAYRLPSEAEWEYACRARTRTAYSWGEEFDERRAALFDLDDGEGRTEPVGSYPPNGFGLYDMHGNVYEWCEDVHHNDYKGAPADGSAWTAGGDASRREIRGGSWCATPYDVRSAYRDQDFPYARFNSYGFRIARTLAPP
jgi:formylglycine-generating enzyme required for sulfatase activity